MASIKYFFNMSISFGNAVPKRRLVYRRAGDTPAFFVMSGLKTDLSFIANRAQVIMSGMLGQTAEAVAIKAHEAGLVDYILVRAEKHA